MTNEIFYQLLTVYYGAPTLVTWSNNKEEIETEKSDYEETITNQEYWIEEGTEYITNKCRGCQTPYANEQCDAHGITTGYWCDACYESDKYPYRKDKYPTIETHGYGERLNDDY